MRRWAALVALALLPVSAGAERREIPLDNRIPVISGRWDFYDAKTSIDGTPYDWWGTGPDRYFAVFDVAGYDWFQSAVGVRDGEEGSGSITVEIEGNEFTKVEVQAGAKAKYLVVPLGGKRAMTLRYQGSAVLAAPKLGKGTPPNGPSTSRPTLGGSERPPVGSTATPPIDPRDIDLLVDGLRQGVDADPGLGARLEQGRIAVATFDLIDIAAPSVARNVAEDLATAMVERRFRLVERGQLDKALQELRLQQSGVFDPDTVRQIGRLTGCTHIVVGSISDRRGLLVYNARLIETDTGRACAAKRVEGRRW